MIQWNERSSMFFLCPTFLSFPMPVFLPLVTRHKSSSSILISYYFFITGAMFYPKTVEYATL